jgi:hypothetical protein
VNGRIVSGSPAPIRDKASRAITKSTSTRFGQTGWFGVIAVGEGDMYPRFGTTMEWDTAAKPFSEPPAAVWTLLTAPRSARANPVSKTTASSPGATATEPADCRLLLGRDFLRETGVPYTLNDRPVMQNLELRVAVPNIAPYPRH